MGVENRPYVGTWQLGRQRVVQHTPDALVYINGDTAVPGCAKCNGRIDIQQFLTEVSVDAGTDPGAASASFTLSIPIHHTDSFARDAKFIFRPGLEVHIYVRGYFPVKGLYKNLAERDIPDDRILTTEQAQQLALEEKEQEEGGSISPEVTQAQLNAELALDEVIPDRLNSSRNGYIGTVTPSSNDTRYRRQLFEVEDENLAMMQNTYSEDRMMGICLAASKETGVPAEWIWGILKGNSGSFPIGVGDGTEFGMAGASRDHFEATKNQEARIAEAKGEDAPSTSKVHWEHSDLIDPQYAAWTVAYDLVQLHDSDPDASYVDVVGFDAYGRSYSEAQIQDRTLAIEQARKQIALGVSSGDIERAWNLGDNIPPVSPQQAAENRDQELANSIIEKRIEEAKARRAAGAGQKPAGDVPSKPSGASLLAAAGLEGSGIEDVLAYPYYHVFHGVVTQVSHSWSGGVSNLSVQCASMLHFWQYHRISTNASVFGARPSNSKLKRSLVGHNFTGMHPYQIIWTLHHDMVGAAGGVGWALSQKTNQTARSEVAGESLFSLNVRYWKRRFNTEMIKLRLHGATGDLFSTAQAAFLGTTSSGKLTKLVRDRFTDGIISRKRHAGAIGILEQAQSVGLLNNRRLEALLLTNQTRPSSRSSTRFELNLVEMQAFVKNVSNMGQVNLFESTYESKLDIAQKVMEITGFEFYQDVDGDFVFKPPMYNLDTSSSRVYRIEDIDIISINFDEKEPEATYVTNKASWGKNIEMGVDNEWGHKGQYIDYRLVAQFGWRPADYETAYFNDSKSMFFAAVNRLDILNAPSQSASVTIPIRPEIRPGYPVFIPYLDAYYYCNSFAHSYSVGGQCTTALQLIAKRAKFFAPGKVGAASSGGIDAIDLSNTILPERPLQVLDRQGRPRLSGFPNVVMALDPEDINELFFVVGNDLERIGDPRVLHGLLKRARDMNLVTLTPWGTYRMKVTVGEKEKGEKQTQWIEFFFQDPNLGESTEAEKRRESKRTTGVPITFVDVEQAAKRYNSRQGKVIEEVSRIGREIDRLNEKLTEAEAEHANETTAYHNATSESRRDQIRARIEKLNRLIDGDVDAKKGSKRKKLGLKATIQDLVDQSQTLQRKFEDGLGDSDQSGVNHLVKLFRDVGEQFLSNNPDIGNLDSTVNLLDMLSDKKATFSNGSQPGSYRYYSASHPKPKQQGQSLVRYVESVGGGKDIETKNPLLEPLWQDVQIEGYKDTVPPSPYPGAPKVEAHLGPMTPVRGIRVLTSNPTKPKGEVLPTSEIRELSFSVQEASLLRDKTSRKKSIFTVSSLGRPVLRALTKRFSLKGSKGRTGSSFLQESTPRSLFEAEWDSQVRAVERAVGEANVALTGSGVKSSSIPPPNYPDIPFPSDVFIHGGGSIGVDEKFGDYKLRDSSGKKTWPGPGTGSRYTMAQVASQHVGRALAKAFFEQVNYTRRIWASKLGAAGFKASYSGSRVGVVEAVGVFNAALHAVWGVAVGGEVSKKSVKSRRQYTEFYSPVFPVSDAAGYEVVGSYRYGRDVSIEPQNVFGGMHFQDVLSYLDRQTVEDVLNAFVRKKGRISGIPLPDKKDKKGNPVIGSMKATSTYAQNALEQRILEQLRKNLTNSQILDLFGQDSDEPTALDSGGGLGNWVADKLKDGIQKVPVVNAAYSLADLRYRNDKRVCGCKAAEAEVLLDAFSQEDFVQFTQPGNMVPEGIGTGEPDRATQYVAGMVARAGATWSQSQAALRGQVMDRGGSAILQSFRDFSSAIAEGSAERRQAIRDFQETALEAVGLGDEEG